MLSVYVTVSMCARGSVGCCCSYPPIQREQYGVTLDVSMDDPLAVQVGQRLKDALAHRCHLLLVKPAITTLMSHISIGHTITENDDN